METFLFFLLGNLLFYGDFAGDPVHAGWKSRQALRNIECERLTQAQAHDRYPAQVPAPNARSAALVQVDALDCRHRIVEEGARDARDDLILQRLQEDVEELSSLASKQAGAKTRWVVDAFYPNPAIVRKVANASRMALAQRGFSVSDQAPLLMAGDVEVFRSLPMRDAIPLACRRLFETGALEGSSHGDDVSFLALALLHPKESQLHAGVCKQGKFRWLR